MSGLGLNRFQRHPRLTELGQTGVPQLMAGRMNKVGPGAGPVEDLVQPVGSQGLAPAWPFQNQEYVVGAGVGWAFGVEVGADMVEELP